MDMDLIESRLEELEMDVKYMRVILHQLIKHFAKELDNEQETTGETTGDQDEV